MSTGVSVCITAYKAQDYIKECLDSVVKQTWFQTHNDWEIIVGIDGCQATLDYIKTIMHNYKNLRVLMMDSNKGTYITSNTIMSNAKYDNLFRFDSDDIMKPELVETIMKKKGTNSYVRYYFKNFGGNTKTGMAWGTVYMTKTIFSKYGGFNAWPVGADSDFYYRIINLEHPQTIRDILMRRRVHSQSLTQSKDTGMKSELRKKYASMIKKNITKSKDAIIKCVTNTYTEIYSSLSGTVSQDDYIKNLEDKPELNKKEIAEETPKSTKGLNIQRLRADIASGKIIKVPYGNGFIWKRVK